MDSAAELAAEAARLKGEEESLGSINRGRGDDFRSPKAEQRFKNRQLALTERLNGKGSGKVHRLANGQYVQMALEKTDKIFVVLVEYGDSDPQTASLAGNGPLHNTIPQPDRATDNNTIWQADYNKAHYEDMYFSKMAAYYQTQSSGRYSVNGAVTEWVKVPFNGKRYGNNSLGDPAAWTLIADAVNVWTQAQLASGKTIQEITDYLKTFDTWDRYDYNNNGNFDEPDGYIDHFQIVHSGAGEETGGGVLGADAIWSHRWQAWFNFAGFTGPSYNRDGGVEFGGGWGANPNGGTFGSSGAGVLGVNTGNANAATVQNAHPVVHTGIWVGDYTIQPENGGLGVFAHEYGHDLGLPDQYERQGGSNSTGFWTIMSSGSYLGDGTTDIGARPGDFYAWDKFQLGWLNYEVGSSTGFSTHRLGPAETNTKQAQAVIVPLNPTLNPFYLFDPASGSLAFGTHTFWGGKGDMMNNSMAREITVPAGTPVLQMRLNYQIENNWDYAYVSVSTDGGAHWTNLAGTWPGGAGGAAVAITTNTNPNSSSAWEGNGITGTSNAWRLASFNMSAYAGQTVLLAIRYRTDEFTSLKGVMADEITLGSFADGAESGDNGWAMSGFKVSTGIENSNAPHYYFAEYRQYKTYDKGLQTGPYTFGYAALPNQVAHYPYQDGLLITYWDTGMDDNDVTLHRGEGRSLVVDGNPVPMSRSFQFPGQPAGTSLWSATVQAYDATLHVEPTDAFTLPFVGSFGGQLFQFQEYIASHPATTVFNDMNDYWFASKSDASVIVPKTGTSIRVVNTSTQGDFMQVQVSH